MSLIPKIQFGSLFSSTISFDYPPIDDDGEKLTAKITEAESQSGVKQVKLNYIEAQRQVTFSFLSETLVGQLQSFYVTHAILGKAFRYYDDKYLTDYNLYQLDKFELEKKKITAVGPSSFIYSLKISMRRIINANDDLDIKETMSANILNNQTSPVSIQGLNFTGSTSGRVSYEVRRVTDTQQKVALGELMLLYKASGWQISDSYFGDATGVSFSVTATGQIQYTSSNLTGSNYSGIIYFTEMKSNG